MEIKRKLYYRLSPKLRRYVRRLYYLPYDLLHPTKGMTPPKGAIFVGQGDYHKQGDRQREELKAHAGLITESDVLDIGCGIGRLAVSLTSYLEPSGSYTGFDVVKEGIDWCHKNISSKHHNFKFFHVDLNNALYNNTHKQACEFRFPFPDNSFDIIALYSVFTHMLEEDVAHYLKEIGRVLRPEGHCLCSMFIIDDDSLGKMNRGESDMKFNQLSDGLFYIDQSLREGNVAFPIDHIAPLIQTADLSIAKFIPGKWRTESSLADQKGDELFSASKYQDIIVLSRSAI